MLEEIYSLEYQWQMEANIVWSLKQCDVKLQNGLILLKIRSRGMVLNTRQ